ncbi:ATP-binding protein [Streptomyces badius]
MSDLDRLRALRHLPPLYALSLHGDLPKTKIGAALEGRRIEVLGVGPNTLLSGLSCLSPLKATLRGLGITKCPTVRT